MENWKKFLNEYRGPFGPGITWRDIEGEETTISLGMWCADLDQARHDGRALFKDSETTDQPTNERRTFALLWEIPPKAADFTRYRLSNHTNFIKYMNCLYNELKRDGWANDMKDFNYIIDKMSPRSSLDVAHPEGKAWRMTKV